LKWSKSIFCIIAPSLLNNNAAIAVLQRAVRPSIYTSELLNQLAQFFTIELALVQRAVVFAIDADVLFERCLIRIDIEDAERDSSR
jgi:hypothetical protein